MYTYTSCDNMLIFNEHHVYTLMSENYINAANIIDKWYDNKIHTHSYENIEEYYK